MMTYFRVRPSMLVVLFASCLGLAGCAGEGAPPDPATPPDDPAEPGASVSVALDLGAFFEREVAAAEVGIAAAHIVLGTLTAAPASGDAGQIFDWSVTLDESDWSIQSNKAVVLTPGTYLFTLLLDDGAHRYAGQAVAVIQDGQNNVAMTVRPVLGDLTILPDLSELPAFRLQYPPEQLAALTNPRLGVIIDGGAEQIVSLDPATGLSDLFIALPEGPHQIRLKLYDGSLQRGRSVAAQENVIVELGQDVHIDLVPLYGETAFELSAEGNRLTVRILVPGEVVDEAGGLAALDARFSLACPAAAPVERQLTLVPAGSAYQAEILIDGVHYGACAYSLTFSDVTTTPPDLVASCSAAVDIGQSDQVASCELLLRRRGVIGGEILAVVAVNVFDANIAPVGGAVISDGTQVLGITGSGAFGPAGYLKLYLAPGPHHLTALHTATQRLGQIDLLVSPLELYNIDILLFEELLTCESGQTCPPPASIPITECQGFDDDCDQTGTQLVETTSYTCVLGGCIAATAAELVECQRDTIQTGC